MHDMSIWHKYLAETFNGQRVNYALLEKLRPPTGGFTKEIIEAIGEKWPVRGNAWVKRCIGNEFQMKTTAPIHREVEKVRAGKANPLKSQGKTMPV